MLIEKHCADSIGRLALTFTAEDAPAYADQQLRDMTAAPHLKALIVVLSDIPDGGPFSERITSIRTCLATVLIPTAAVLSETASKAAKEIADACLFQYTGPEDALAAAVASAEAALTALTARRPRRVITAVMQSLHNAETLPIEDALLQETQLFCELSRQNQQREEEETP